MQEGTHGEMLSGGGKDPEEADGSGMSSSGGTGSPPPDKESPSRTPEKGWKSLQQAAWKNLQPRVITFALSTGAILIYTFWTYAKNTPFLIRLTEERITINDLRVLPGPPNIQMSAILEGFPLGSEPDRYRFQARIQLDSQFSPAIPCFIVNDQKAGSGGYWRFDASATYIERYWQGLRLYDFSRKQASIMLELFEEGKRVAISPPFPFPHPSELENSADSFWLQISASTTLQACADRQKLALEQYGVRCNIETVTFPGERIASEDQDPENPKGVWHRLLVTEPFHTPREAKDFYNSNFGGTRTFYDYVILPGYEVRNGPAIAHTAPEEARRTQASP